MAAPTPVAGAPADPDADLLAATAAGDAAAFEALVRRHQERVIGVCQRLLGGPEDARDTAQDVFLKVYRKAGSFRPRARVSTWIYRIAVNLCLNRLRRRKLVRFLPLGGGGGTRDGDDAPEREPLDPAPGPEAALEARRRWAATRRAIDALPESQRAVLVLARFEGLSYREIAEVLGLTVGAVESRLFRAMRNLERAQGSPHPRVS